MARKWFVLVDRDGLLLRPSYAVVIDIGVVANLRTAVTALYHLTLAAVDPSDLAVYAQMDALIMGTPPLASAASVRSLGTTEEDPLVVVAPLTKAELQTRTPTAPLTALPPMAPLDAEWIGSLRMPDNQCNHHIYDRLTLPRASLTAKARTLLDRTHVVQLEAPSMTGKTALFCDDLMDRSRVRIASFSMRRKGYRTTFQDAFQHDCGLAFADFVAMREQGYTLYLVVDDAALLYQTSAAGTLLFASSDLWNLVQDVLTGTIDGVRVLLLAAFGAHVRPDTGLSPPVHLAPQYILGMDDLHLSAEETADYVATNLGGDEHLGEATTTFCAALRALTGGHVGCCAAAMSTMNGMADARLYQQETPPTAREWLTLLQGGSLDRKRLDPYP